MSYPKQSACHVINGRKSQDLAYVGKTKQYMYGVVYDGHGRYNCINMIKSIHSENPDDMVSHTNPVQYMFDKTIGCVGGSTMNFFRVDRVSSLIENFSIGDSHSWIWDITDAKHPCLVMVNKKHVPDDTEEIERLSTLRLMSPSTMTSIRNSMVRKTLVHSEDTMEQYDFYNQVVYFQRNDHSVDGLAMTQALGHFGLTQCSCFQYVYRPIPGHTYLCMAASDGVTDVVTYDMIRTIIMESLLDIPGRLCSLARRQWMRPWRLVRNGAQPIVSSFPMSEWDDISVCVNFVVA
jgi:hypothetical protein